MTFTEVMDHVAQAFDALGVLILVIGMIWSIWLGTTAWRRSHQAATGYKAVKQAFGGTLLLSVEIFVAADLVRTVVVAPTLDNILILGLIVLIRTFLSFSLEIEIEGVPPWRRAMTSGAGVIRRTSQTVLGNDTPLDRALPARARKARPQHGPAAVNAAVSLAIRTR